MTIEDLRLEDVKIEYENRIRKLNEEAEVLRYENSQLKELSQNLRQRMVNIQEILCALDNHYNESPADVTYKHSEISNGEYDWLYRINQLSYLPKDYHLVINGGRS